MKKAIFLPLLLMIISSSVYAQTVHFGIKAGINYANQNGSNITINSTNYRTSAITSYHAGLVAEIGVFKGFALQPELLYSTKGATYKDAITEFKNELGYISIPLLAKINLSKSITLDLGPQASFLLSERNNLSSKDTKSFDFGAAAGLSLNITKHLFIQGRYVLGLSDVSKDAEIKNSVVQVSAGIMF